MTRLRVLAGLAAIALAGRVEADPAPFDLTGPTLTVTVTRGGTALPIASVPELAEGDQLLVRADLPADQSAHYLLIAAFLRGTTNPPPDDWFFQSESWTKKGRSGLRIAVPKGAQQVLLFLAPETGGDFSTLRSAVRARPGAFVRAAQDLNQASLDRSRLDLFLRAVGRTDPADPGRIARITPELARSLSVKINPDCLDKAAELQAACLMQNQDALVLNDGHSSAITDTLTGPGADLALQLSATPQGGLGMYSPYIGAIRDIIGIFSSFHTAKYQYIPGLKTERGDRIDLVLNAPPSFRNPKSVIVTALPSIAPSRLPPLRLGDPAAPVCGSGAALTLPVSGAPLIFSTSYAHHMALRVSGADGASVDLPAAAVAEQGGYVVSGGAPRLASLTGPLRATLHGRWGFSAFDGPTAPLQLARPGQWTIENGGNRALVVGRPSPLALTGGAAACVTGATLRLASGDLRDVEWKVTGPNRVMLTLPLADMPPGEATLLLRQTGLAEPEAVPVRAYAETSRLDSFAIHAGDRRATLVGARLDQVSEVGLGGQRLLPGPLARTPRGDELTLDAAADAPPPGTAAGQALTARVQFKDGRSAALGVTVQPARPRAEIVTRAVQAPAQTGPVTLRLTDAGELPRGAVLTFSLRLAGGRWSDGATLEIAPAGSGGSIMLAPGKGLALQDDTVAVATLDTARQFTEPAFGQLRFRVVRGGDAGDWQPLATLVRLPSLHQLTCVADAQGPCELTGEDLYLIRSVSADPAFAQAMEVPDGYVGTSLRVPRPVGGKLMVRLRDAPTVANELVAGGAAQASAAPPPPAAMDAARP